MATRRRLILVGSVILLSAGCAGHFVYASGAYRGKVVDAGTGQPLAGAVVLAVWYREVPTAPHGPAVDYHDALEVLTDAQGEFLIPAKTHVTPIGKIREPEFVIYYPGYGYYPVFQTEPTGGAVTHAFRQYTVVKLPQWRTQRDRRKVLDLPVWTSKVPGENMPNLIKLANQEGREIGVTPLYGREKSK